MLQNLAKLWNLSELIPISTSPYTSIFSALQNTRPVILKISEDAQQESQILKLYQNYGAIEVLETNNNAMLLEQAFPGTSLKSYFPTREAEAIKIVCNVMQKLHKAPIPSGANLPHLKDRLKALDNASVPHIEKARNVRDSLLATTTSNVLLHGDLHHDNILMHGDDWIVIDPKGFIGDATYEPACFIHNPIPELLSMNNADEIIRMRIKAFAHELSIDEKRIADWCFVVAVLAHVWAIEDGIGGEYFAKIVDIIHRLTSTTPHTQTSHQ